MKRKTKEITNTKRHQKPKLLDDLLLNLTTEQKQRLQALAQKDNHSSLEDWAKKQLLRVLADRYRETL